MDAARNQKRCLAIQAMAREAENMAINFHKLASLYGASKRGANNDLKEQMTKRLKLVDPKEPEKPKPAYNYFIKENYSVIRKKSPDNSNRENMKELAALWRETRAEDKKHYEDLADIDKKRYGTEYRKYVAFRLEHPYYPEKHGVTMNIKKLQQKKQAKADAPSINRSTDKKEKVKEEEGSHDNDNDRSVISQLSTSEPSESDSSVDSESSIASSLVSVSFPVAAASYPTSYDLDDFDDDELDDTETSTSATKPASIPKPKLVSSPPKEAQNKNNDNLQAPKFTKKKRFFLGKNRQRRRQRRRRQKQKNGKSYDNNKKMKGESKWRD